MIDRDDTKTLPLPGIEPRRLANGEPCRCKRADAWRCACEQGLRTIACYCRCHRRVQPGPQR